MGACATKPKVLKDDAEAPVPGPEQAEQEAPAVLVEEENKVVERELDVEASGDDKKEESLGSLLKENEAEVVTELPREPESAPAPIDLAPDEPKPELSTAEIPPVAVEGEAKSDEAAEKKHEESK